MNPSGLFTGTFPVKPYLVPQHLNECFSKHSDYFVKVAYAPGREVGGFFFNVFGQIVSWGKLSRTGYRKPEAWKLSFYLGWTAVLAGSK